jgi:hypothetical protein
VRLLVYGDTVTKTGARIRLNLEELACLASDMAAKQGAMAA